MERPRNPLGGDHTNVAAPGSGEQGGPGRSERRQLHFCPEAGVSFHREDGGWSEKCDFFFFLIRCWVWWIYRVLAASRFILRPYNGREDTGAGRWHHLARKCGLTDLAPGLPSPGALPGNPSSGSFFIFPSDSHTSLSVSQLQPPGILCRIQGHLCTW